MASAVLLKCWRHKWPCTCVISLFEQRPAELRPADMTPCEVFPPGYSGDEQPPSAFCSQSGKQQEKYLSMSERRTTAKAAEEPDFLQFNDLSCETVGGKVKHQTRHLKTLTDKIKRIHWGAEESLNSSVYLIQMASLSIYILTGGCANSKVSCGSSKLLSIDRSLQTLMIAVHPSIFQL